MIYCNISPMQIIKTAHSYISGHQHNANRSQTHIWSQGSCLKWYLLAIHLSYVVLLMLIVNDLANHTRSMKRFFVSCDSVSWNKISACYMFLPNKDTNRVHIFCHTCVIFPSNLILSPKFAMKRVFGNPQVIFAMIYSGPNKQILVS